MHSFALRFRLSVLQGLLKLILEILTEPLRISKMRHVAACELQEQSELASLVLLRLKKMLPHPSKDFTEGESAALVSAT